MVLANTLGDSPRNYGNRPVNTLKLTYVKTSNAEQYTVKEESDIAGDDSVNYEKWTNYSMHGTTFL